MNERRVVEWKDVARDAELLFDVWTEGHELYWAMKCWQALVQKGLASYSNQLEYTLVLIRLIALAQMYKDFCDLAFYEYHDSEHNKWADELGLSNFRIAQCVGSDFEI